MNINIYQIDMKRDTHRVAFTNLEDTKTFQKSEKIDSAIYDRVFSGEVDCIDLERVYEKFNIDQPDGYRGRSLSVSDIVEITEGDKKGFYFCDCVGFKEVRFEPERAEDKSKGSTIRVVLLEPGKVAQIADIDSSLEGLQKAVGGYIEAYYPFEDEECCVVCNEEGKITGLPLNRAIYDKPAGVGNEDRQIVDIIAGPCFICDCSGENFGSLSDEQLSRYCKEFRYPEQFYRAGNEIKAVPYKPIERGDAR